MGGVTQQSTLPSSPAVRQPSEAAVRRYLHGFPLPPTSAAEHTESQNNQERDEGISGGSDFFEECSIDSGEDEESGDDSDFEESTPGEVEWEPLEEDTSRPSAEEMRKMECRPERSALDHPFWADKLFSEKLEDPEVPLMSYGRMDWIIDRFNGSTSNANLEPYMLSDAFALGGLEWQLKFYPRGKWDDHLSIFLECVSMLSDEYAEYEDFVDPVFPFLKGAPRPQKRRAVTMQYTIIMYNPNEPRVYEAKTGAHVFHKRAPSGGFPYFSEVPYQQFNKRRPGQRRALLQNDQLAISAHFQIIEDPTWSVGCPEMGRTDDPIEVFGLRSFSHETPWRSLAVILLHFEPFRDLVRRHNGNRFDWLKRMLTLMYARKYSGQREPTMSDGHDFMECFDRLCNMMAEGPEAYTLLSRICQEVIGHPLSPNRAWGRNRLDTVSYPSIQGAINHHAGDHSTSVLLALELTRHHFDTETRKFTKVTNQVEVQDHIVVGTHGYMLYAFVTHIGPVQDGDYHAYVRPQGFAKGWYQYGCGDVNRFTERQARAVHSRGGIRHPDAEVTCAVIYVREDWCDRAFSPILEEELLPQMLRWGIDRNSAHDETGQESADTAVTPDDIREYLSRAGEMTTPNRSLVRFAGGRDAEDGERSLPYDNSSLVPHDVHEEFVRFSCQRDAIWPSGGNDTTIHSDWLGKEFYSGGLLNNKMHGVGRHIAKSGNHYCGFFSEGSYHGHGKMIYAASGDIYEGEWKDNVPHGAGTLTTHETGAVIHGQWMFGSMIEPSILRGLVIDDGRGLCSICHERKDGVDFLTCSHRLTCALCSEAAIGCEECHQTNRYRRMVMRAILRARVDEVTAGRDSVASNLQD